MPTNINPLDGFDPLTTSTQGENAAFAQIFEDANKRVVHNILKSYTGYFDLFSELLQNALDAVQAKNDTALPSYKPTIWIEIDIPGNRVRVVDNGVGMSEQQLRFCLRPNISFKLQADLRGHKGVGATFLAYGYSFIKLQSKQQGHGLAVNLRQGRQWAEDVGGTIPRPKFEAEDFAVPELAREDSGTCVEIIVGQASGERPKNLGWLNAYKAGQWLDILRIKTPLGGIYLSTAHFYPTVHLIVRAPDGSPDEITSIKPEYYYPHEIPTLKVASLREIIKSLDNISGDPATKFAKLPMEFKKLDCIYDVWTSNEILDETSNILGTLSEEQRVLVERHKVVVYASFLRSARLWSDFNDDVLRLRKGQKIIHGGLQIASDYMPQGDLSIIPLTSTIGYQANSHIIVHLTDGNPDMGRKVFQPEIKSLAEILAVRAVNLMKRFLQHMKPDTGAQTITPDKEVHDWKKQQEVYRERYPLSYKHENRYLALASHPQQEQDVLALFHELIGIGLLRGFRFYATSQSDRYDSLFFMEHSAAENTYFEKRTNHLGIARSFSLPLITEPKILEYKYSFDSLVMDFDKEVKYAKHINFVVCWNAGTEYKEKFHLEPLLVGDGGSDRTIFGSTHQAFSVAALTQPAFEVLVLEDLLRWLTDPEGEEARQKQAYRD